MTPTQLQQALAAMPPRQAQQLLFRCVDGQTDDECAALYGVQRAQWDLLLFEAARSFSGETQPLPDAVRIPLAAQLQHSLTEPTLWSQPLVAPLRALIEHREEVRRLMVETERLAAQSPARARETWLRRVAMVVIVVVSWFVWKRDHTPPPEPPAHSR